MKKTLWMYSAALLMSSQIVSAIEVNGYFRTGIGGTDHGDMQECFDLIVIFFVFLRKNDFDCVISNCHDIVVTYFGGL